MFLLTYLKKSSCFSYLTFLSSGSTERKDERRAQQASVGHRGPAPHRVQRASAAPPQRADGGPRGEGCR